MHYDGKNGHPYSSIGRYLIDKGLLAADKVSMGCARAKWLRADPERGKGWSCRRMRPTCSSANYGNNSTRARSARMNAQLTPGRSLAVDTSHQRAQQRPSMSAAGNMGHVESGRLLQPADGGAGRRLCDQGPRARRHLLRLRAMRPASWPASPSTPASFIVLLPVAAHSAAQVHERLPERLPWQKIEKAER